MKRKRDGEAKYIYRIFVSMNHKKIQTSNMKYSILLEHNILANKKKKGTKKEKRKFTMKANIVPW